MCACSSSSNQEPLTDTSKTMDPIQAKIKERAEVVTKELARQKEIKASIKELPIIEKFTRKTEEKAVVEILGKPVSMKNVSIEGIQQRVLYYKQSKYAVWLWRESGDSGPYQFRAAVSINDTGKFDAPLFNVLEEGELSMLRNMFEKEE